MLEQNASPDLQAGKTNSRVKSKKAKKNTGSENLTDTSEIQKAAELQSEMPQPDYSSMETEIEKISNPVSFDALKAFYGLD